MSAQSTSATSSLSGPAAMSSLTSRARYMICTWPMRATLYMASRRSISMVAQASSRASRAAACSVVSPSSM
jgi:hypothetical protein